MLRRTENPLLGDSCHSAFGTTSMSSLGEDTISSSDSGLPIHSLLHLEDDRGIDFSSSNHYRATINTSSTSIRSQGDHLIARRLRDYGIVPLSPKFKTKNHRTTIKVKRAVEEVHRWLFVEGGHFESVEALMTNYCLLVRGLGIPVDRLYYGGIALHPRLSAYLWKWELHDFVFREMPQEIFERRNEIFSPDEPFCILEQGRADSVRILHTDEYIAPDTEKWFRAGNYKDYFALPDIHRNESKGSLAWATKEEGGFSDDHIAFFKSTLPAVTTVLRLHTNDLVLRTLTEAMEKEVEERTQELADTNKQLEEANDRLAVQAKKQVEHFACMSHEIRTPLNCIVGLSSLPPDTPEEMAESMKMIHTSSELLTAVVDDVLDYSKMESGVFEVDIRPSSLPEAWNAVIHTMQEKASRRNVQIIAEVGPCVPEIVRTDSRRLQQILYNIVGNACKFSEEGGTVEVEASVYREIKEPKLRFRVKDFGKGIHSKDMEAIFQPFNQASKETQTFYGGTGLGLSIVSSLVKRLGGTISVDSVVGEYAEFVVELPLEEEPVNVAEVRQALGKTSVVVLSGDGTTEITPFKTKVAKKYDFDLIDANTWDEATLKIPEGHLSDNQFIFVTPVENFDRPAFARFQKLAKNTILVTHGIAKPPTESELHWKSLKHKFPSVAVSELALLITKIQESRESNVPPSSIRHEALHVSKPSESPNVVTCLRGESQTEPTEEGSTKETPRILIAEDNLVNQKVLRRVLNKLGVKCVDIVDNGEKAVEQSATIQYDIVFMDVQMPIMDGLEATEKIKARGCSHSSDPKVIFCTAHAVEDFRRQAEASGGDGFVSKPFNAQKIQAVLETHGIQL